MTATLEQARLYTYYAAGRADRGEPIITEAALAKLLAADGCNEVCQTTPISRSSAAARV